MAVFMSTKVLSVSFEALLEAYALNFMNTPSRLQDRLLLHDYLVHRQDWHGHSVTMPVLTMHLIGTVDVSAYLLIGGFIRKNLQSENKFFEEMREMKQGLI